MWRLLFFLLLYQSFTAQNTIKGRIQSEDNVPLNGVLVMNMTSSERVVSDNEGNFSIPANIGEELRFIRKGHERASVVVQVEHFQYFPLVKLKSIVQEIPQVEILALSGNLAKDSKKVGEAKRTTNMKIDLGRYIKFRKTSPQNLKPKQGEFVQPKGNGFSIGKVKDKWTSIDLVEHLISSIEESFFTEDLQLKKEEISPFVHFSIQDFQGLRTILKYGYCSEKDQVRYIEHAYKKILDYKTNVKTNH